MQLTQSFVSLLQELQCVFTSPSFVTFVSLMTGWIYSYRHRYVTELIQSSDCTRNGHHSRYHRFFSAASWCLDTLSCLLARLLVKVLAPTGVIELAIDDWNCRVVNSPLTHFQPRDAGRFAPCEPGGLHCNYNRVKRLMCLPSARRRPHAIMVLESRRAGG